jgi:hypothetical protein
MVAPVAIAAGKKAAPAAKAAARKASDNPGAVLLIGAIGLLMFGQVAKKIPKLPTVPDVSGLVDRVNAPFNWVDREINALRNPPSGSFSWQDPLAELRQDAVTVKRFSSRSTAFLGGVVQDYDEDDGLGQDYYGQVHYDDSGVPVAVPVDVNRDSRLLGGRVRDALRFW